MNHGVVRTALAANNLNLALEKLSKSRILSHDDNFKLFSLFRTEITNPNTPLVDRKSLCTNFIRMSNSLLASNIPIQPRTAEPIIHIYSTLGMLAPAQTIHSIASRVSKKADSDLENKFLINLHLLKAYANAQLMSKAETLLKEILENPVQPTWLSGLWEVFHIMLSAYAHLKDPKSAFKLLDHGIFHDLINVSAHADKDGTTLRGILEMMQQLELEPTNITYNTLMAAYIKQNQINKALALFDVMVEKAKSDQTLSPTVENYCTLLHAFAKKGDLENAKTLFSNMLSGNIKPNLVSYHILMTAFKNAGDIQGCHDLFEQMKLAAPISTYSFNILLSCYTKQPAKMLQKYKDFLNSGLLPDIVTFNTLLSSLGNSFDLDNIDSIFNEMRINYSIDPTCETITSILVNYFRFTFEWNRARNTNVELLCKRTPLDIMHQAENYHDILVSMDSIKSESTELLFSIKCWERRTRVSSNMMTFEEKINDDFRDYRELFVGRDLPPRSDTLKRLLFARNRDKVNDGNQVEMDLLLRVYSDLAKYGVDIPVSYHEWFAKEVSKLEGKGLRV